MSNENTGSLAASVTVQLQGKKVFLLDTGSSANLIKFSAVPKGLTLRKYHAKLSGIGPGLVEPIGCLTLPIRIKNTVFKTFFRGLSRFN